MPTGSKIEFKLNHDFMDASGRYLRSRMHVICFDSIPEESDPMRKKGDTFEVQIPKAGLYNYKCSIYTRMRGKIEVTEKEAKKVSKLTFDYYRPAAPITRTEF